MNLSTGCGDNSCIHGRPGGMGTNGGCSCKRTRPKTVLATLRDLRDEAEAHGPVSLTADNILDLLTEIEGRDKEIARLQEALRQRDDQLRNALDVNRAALEPPCATHTAEHRMRDTLPCPWCVIDELKRNRDDWKGIAETANDNFQKLMKAQSAQPPGDGYDANGSPVNT